MQRKPAIVIGGIMLLYIVLRLWGLTDACFWFDEIFSIHAAEHSWSGLVPFVAKDLIHPPLFYFLLKLWITLGGEGQFWLRLFPVVFAVLALVPFWLLCRELKLRLVTVAVAFGLFAVNGALIKYAQEVRMYSLLLFLSLTSIWLFSRFFFRGKSFWVLVIANVLLVYSHYFGWFVVAAEVTAILIAQRIKLLQILLMAGAVAASFAPWLFALFHFAEPGSSVRQNIGWMPRPGIGSLFELVFDLVDPFYSQQSTIDPTANFIIAVPMIIIIAGALAVYLLRFGREENRDRIFFLLGLCVVPLLLAFVLSWLLPVSIWGSRHLIIIFPLVILLAAHVLCSERLGKWKFALIGPVAILIIAGFLQYARATQYENIWCAWGRLENELPARHPKTVYVFEDLVAYQLWFATRRDEETAVVKVTGVPGIAEDKAYFLPRGFDGVKQINLSEIDADRFWVMFRDDEWNVEDPPINALAGLGYSIRQIAAIRTRSGTAFVAEVTR